MRLTPPGSSTQSSTQSSAGAPGARWRRVAGGASIAVALLTTAAASALVVAVDRLGEPPLDTTRAVSVQVLDRHERLLRAFTTQDGRWRLPVAIGGVDPGYVALLLAYEDKRFHRHHGVDPMAILRALWQTAAHGRIVSGASTLSMQVARLMEPRGTRSLGAKLREALRALQIEARLDKRQILELYLALAPFGGNLEGVRAASLTYFGKEPRRLALHEAALLVALPQAPELRRPDRFPAAARRARDRVLLRATKAGAIPMAEAQAAMSRPVPTRRRSFPMLAGHLAQASLASEPGRTVHRLTIDRSMQATLERLAAERAQWLGAKQSVAIVVIDNASAEVLVHVGSAGFLDAARAGQVDMAEALRSPGSTLKPFVYGLAFERGLAHPETLIEDRPSRFGTYAPRNFDQAFQGTVTVREALQLSLNVPAVQMLDAVGPARLLMRLRAAGARVELPGEHAPGLAIALGGVGISLVDLARLYAGIARQGEPVALRRRLPSPRRDARAAKATGGRDIALPQRLLSPAAAWYVADILRGTPPPANAAPGAIAFKTGTSYGYRDAWAAGFDGQYTVAVWAGRPDGASSPGMTGITAAAPILHEAFARLAPARKILPTAPAAIIQASTAGLPPPLRTFRATASQSSQGPKIAFPADGARVEVENAGSQGVALKVEGGALPLTWLVNGAPIATAPRQRTAFWRPDGDGFAQLTVVDGRGRSAQARFRIDRRR